MWDVMPRGTLYHWSLRHLGHIALGFLSRLCFALGRFVDAAILLVGYVYIIHHFLPECDPTVTISWSSYFPLCKLPTPVSFLKYLKNISLLC